MADDKTKPELTPKRVAKIATIVGMVLAIVCQVVPPKYQVACTLMAQIAPHACH